MKLKLSFLKPELLATLSGGKSVTFVDHSSHRAANDEQFKPTDKIDWNSLSLEVPTVFEQWSIC